MADAAPAALITGATSGLGRYLARQLASSGWQVLAHGRDPARVADLTAELGGGARMSDPQRHRMQRLAVERRCCL